MKEIKPALLMLVLFTIICGGIYPAVVTGLAQIIFPRQAMGSFVTNPAGKVVGSTFIGQPFSESFSVLNKKRGPIPFGIGPLFYALF